MFSHVCERTIEWADCDPAGIVFYPRFFEMFDAATASLLHAASGMKRVELIRHFDILGWPMVSSQTQFYRPVTFDDRVAIEATVVRAGTASFAIDHVLRHGEDVCVSNSEVRVWSGRESEGGPIKAVPLPESLRQTLLGQRE